MPTTPCIDSDNQQEIERINKVTQLMNKAIRARHSKQIFDYLAQQSKRFEEQQENFEQAQRRFIRWY